MVSKWIARDTIDGFVFNYDMEVHFDQFIVRLTNDLCLNEEGTGWNEYLKS